MKTALILKLALGATAMGVATLGAAMPAAASPELAKKHACLSCHAIDKKVIGPSYKDVAAKYKGKPGAAAMLAQKIKKGSTGVWGKVPMPPKPTISDADAKALATWLLATK